MAEWTGRLPKLDTQLAEMTDDEVRALMSFRWDELKREWCGTLILQSIDELRHELARRGIDDEASNG